MPTTVELLKPSAITQIEQHLTDAVADLTQAAQTAAGQANTNAAIAQGAAALSGAQIFASVADGIAGVSDGSVFAVPDSGGSGLEIRRRAGAGSTVIGTLSVPAQGRTDPTPGRLMPNGHGGLMADVPPAINDFTSDLRPGFYQYGEASAIGAPGSGSPWFGHALVNRLPNGSIWVLATRRNSPNPRTWIGTRSGTSGALTWIEIYQEQSILGTVAAAGGAAIEVDVAAGLGGYVVLRGGLMIAWVDDFDLGSIVGAGAGTFADPYRTDAVQSLTWPRAFAAGPVVSHMLRLSGDTVVNPSSRSLLLQVTSQPGPTGWNNLRAQRVSGDTIDRNALLSCTAIGQVAF